ncbi:MAG TPA: diguanylate cyclase [Bryobacteraceae bacterium]|nr:diguanylate cyclase [Bryobacteraceae bacterium]
MLASYEIKAAAAGLAICLVGISAAVYHASTKLVENAHWVAHTHQVLTQLEAAAGVVAGAEIRGPLEALRQLTADNPVQQARIGKLERLIQRRPHPEEIRRGVQEMAHEEQELLASRFAQQESDSLRLKWMVVLSCAAALFLLCVALAVLFHDLSAFEAAFREAKYTVAHDTLTELASRDSLMVQLDVAMAQAAHTGQPLSVCICDIDRFKSVNDTHGHAAGDEILTAFGKLVRGGIRIGDIAGRLGGDEFCIVLPNTSGDRAGPLMERLRESWERLEYRAPDGRACSVTASFGVVQYGGERTAKALLHAADQALYCAKGQGRNRMHLVLAA